MHVTNTTSAFLSENARPVSTSVIPASYGFKVNYSGRAFVSLTQLFGAISQKILFYYFGHCFSCIVLYCNVFLTFRLLLQLQL